MFHVSLAANTVREQKECFTAPMGNDIYQFSSFPWVSFTHISHMESGRKDNATPMIDWGKYFIRDEKVMLPFSVQVHQEYISFRESGASQLSDPKYTTRVTTGIRRSVFQKPLRNSLSVGVSFLSG